jgi:hypothetical protein
MKTIALNTLEPNDRNPRKITDEALQKLCESIERDPQFMELRPIVVDENNVILGGNQRYRACLKLGKETVPASWVKVATGLTDEQRKRFIIVDNGPEGMSGDWDAELLKIDWDVPELSALGLDNLLVELDANVEPFGDTSTDRDGQGVASTWESCQKTGAAPVRIGPMESRVKVEIAQRIVEKCEQEFNANGTPIHQTLEAMLLCALQ